MTDESPILEVQNLCKYFNQQSGFVQRLLSNQSRTIQAVDNVSFTLEKNESMAVIGESGCGKSTLLFTLMGLHEPTDGEILFRGQPVSKFTKGDWKEFRSNVQIIFQDPFNSLDPKLTIEETLTEPLKVHDMNDRENRIRTALEHVELYPPDQYLDRFPRELSGGEKQRISIARALVVEPEVILADEPVSMLDVSTQAAVLDTLEQLINDLGVAMIYISHDLSTVSYIAQEVNVMYLGRVVETAPTRTLLDDPKHPYSRELIQAIPIPDPSHERERTEMSGSPQDPVGLGEGCRFRDRCPERMDVCEHTPKYLEVEDSHKVACHLHYDHPIDETKTAGENRAN